MMIKEARFIKSSAQIEDCPEGVFPEYAFIGRSNVGKSSLINMLTNRKNLAKTSSRPGKTQLINHFNIDDSWYMVDLPGYGWSKVSKELKASWGVMIEDYLIKRESLACLFILLDGRHEPQKIDYDFITWAGEQGIPFALIFTKTDKLSVNQFQSVKAKHLKNLKSIFTDIPKMFSTSSEKNTGGEEVIKFVLEVNDVYGKSE